MGRLTPIPWLKVAVLVNPLVYMSEGLRAGLTPVPHMPGPPSTPPWSASPALLATIGIRGFRKRVLLLALGPGRSLGLRLYDESVCESEGLTTSPVASHRLR